MQRRGGLQTARAIHAASASVPTPKAPIEQEHPASLWELGAGKWHQLLPSEPFIYLFIAISLALRRLYLSLISDTKEAAGSQGRRE